MQTRAQKSERSSVCIAQRSRGWCTILTLSEKAELSLTSSGSLAPFLPLCFALFRTPQSSLAGERRVEETAYSLSSPLSPPRCEARRIRSGDGVESSSECIRVSRLRGVSETPFHPSSPSPSSSCAGTFSDSLRPYILRVFFPAPLPPCERARGVREKERRSEGGRRARGKPRRLMEYIMMRPAVLRRLNGRVCVLCKRWSRRRREIFVAAGERGSIILKYIGRKKEKDCIQIDHKFVRWSKNK